MSPLSIVPTPGAANANSYVSEAEADDYALGSAYATTWAAASSASKISLLVRARRAMDSFAHYLGDRVDSTQAAEWPRRGVYDPAGFLYSETGIPAAVKDAQCHLACWLATQTGDDPFGVNSTAPLSSLTAGAVKMDFREGVPTPGIVFFMDAIVPILRAGRCIASGSPLMR